jgi:hypothetical protein
MAETALVNRDLASGRDLVLHLDEAGFSVFAALWLLRPDSSDWTFYLGSEEVDKVGRHDAYGRLQKILIDTDSAVPLRSISLVGASDQLLSLITGAIAVEGVSEIRVQNSMFNGVLIPDAVIYRLRRPNTTTTLQSGAAATGGNTSNTPRLKPKPTKRTGAPSSKRRKR